MKWTWWIEPQVGVVNTFVRLAENREVIPDGPWVQDPHHPPNPPPDSYREWIVFAGAEVEVT